MTMPKMDNDRVGHVVAELDAQDNARGDVERESPGTSRSGSDSVLAGRRINEFTLRGEVASADGAPKGWQIRLVRLEDRVGIGEILPLPSSLRLLSFSFFLYRHLDGL